ncbi:MAG: polysaccharide synthesis protein GtrA [Actinobacteria bacterium 13_2_20CM_2_71_6]|nr:MAG: polysaccharide synthesis protein GtrA [Actinobacteria bacterium 13_2_20CM_2_71_6]
MPYRTAGRYAARVTALWERFGHLVRELGKFGVVGATAYAIDLGVYLLLYDTKLGWFWAKVVSTVIAATVAFIGNRFWTWRDRARSGLHREYVLYFFFNAVGLGIALGCLWLSHSGFGHFWPQTFHTKLADTIAAQGFGLVLGTTFRFWAYKRFVFLAASTDEGAEELAGEAVSSR